jgi:hypothetical protein
LRLAVFGAIVVGAVPGGVFRILAGPKIKSLKAENQEWVGAILGLGLSRPQPFKKAGGASREFSCQGDGQCGRGVGKK